MKIQPSGTNSTSIIVLGNGINSFLYIFSLQMKSTIDDHRQAVSQLIDSISILAKNRFMSFDEGIILSNLTIC